MWNYVCLSVYKDLTNCSAFREYTYWLYNIVFGYFPACGTPFIPFEKMLHHHKKLRQIILRIK